MPRDHGYCRDYGDCRDYRGTVEDTYDRRRLELVLERRLERGKVMIPCPVVSCLYAFIREVSTWSADNGRE